MQIRLCCIHMTKYRSNLPICNNHSAYFFCGQENLLDWQFYTISKFNLLGRQSRSNLLGGQMPTQLTCFYLLACIIVKRAFGRLSKDPGCQMIPLWLTKTVWITDQHNATVRVSVSILKLSAGILI